MTRDQILTAAFDEAVQSGFYTMTRDNIAERAGVATGSVNHHFKDMANLRHAVMRKAIQVERLCIIATGLSQGDDIARSAPEGLKRRALETLV